MSVDNGTPQNSSRGRSSNTRARNKRHCFAKQLVLSESVEVSAAASSAETRFSQAANETPVLVSPDFAVNCHNWNALLDSRQPLTVLDEIIACYINDLDSRLLSESEERKLRATLYEYRKRRQAELEICAPVLGEGDWVEDVRNAYGDPTAESTLYARVQTARNGSSVGVIYPFLRAKNCVEQVPAWMWRPVAAELAAELEAKYQHIQSAETKAKQPMQIIQPKFKALQVVKVDCPHRVGKDLPCMHGLIGVVEDSLSDESGHVQYKLNVTAGDRTGVYWAPETWLTPFSREAEQAEIVHDAIARLELEMQQLLAEGAPAPDGCWIETGKVKGKEFRQAWWRSERPMFQSRRSRGNVEALTKTQYIGKEGGNEHKAAMAAKERRERLRAIKKQIELLSKEAEL